MMEKVLLVNPPFNRIIYPASWKQMAYEPPLGLAYLASYVRESGISIDILDANALLYQIDESARKIVSWGAELVGFTVVTMTVPIVSEIIKRIKAVDKEIKIVVGGPHVSFTAEQTLNDNPGIDFVTIGEGEETFKELIEVIQAEGRPETVKGLAFRQNGSIVVNEPRAVLANIDTIPFPARELLPLKCYNPTLLFNIGFKGEKYTTIITSRGCPSRCTYCSSRAFWKTFRMRSAENISKEIDYLVKRCNVKHLYFVDDTLTSNKERLYKICDHIIKRRLNIKWHCFSKVNSVSDESLKKMKRAGCFCITYGLESGVQDILNSIKKDISLHSARRALYLTKKNNIIADCSFMFGLPGETKETMEETVRFAIELNPHVVLFYFTTPFPGTELFREAKDKGWLKKDLKWEEFSLHKGCIMNLPNLGMEEVNKKVEQAYRRFYFRICYFRQVLFSILRNPVSLKIYIQCGMIFFRQIISSFITNILPFSENK